MHLQWLVVIRTDYPDRVGGGEPWEDVYLETCDVFEGSGDDVLQDYRQALKLYKQAAKLGSVCAYHAIGSIVRARTRAIKPQKELA